jgi:hypothetical protein
MKIDHIEININIYCLTVIVTWEPDINKIADFCKERGVEMEADKKEQLSNIQKISTGFCIRINDDNPDIVIWLHKKPQRLCDYGILYHELYHAVDFIKKDKNLNEEIESPAYLYEMLVNNCNNSFWRNKAKTGMDKDFFIYSSEDQKRDRRMKKNLNHK